MEILTCVTLAGLPFTKSFFGADMEGMKAKIRWFWFLRKGKILPLLAVITVAVASFISGPTFLNPATALSNPSAAVVAAYNASGPTCSTDCANDAGVQFCCLTNL